MNKVCLLILDGAGYSTDPDGNVVTPPLMPNLYSAMERGGHAVLSASGPEVGLEAGQVGNSESGHMTIGAGTRVPAMSVHIEEQFQNGEWAAHSLWERVRGEPLHIVGLLSSAGVHGFARTLHQAAELARDRGAAEVIVHPVLDGVDSPRGSAPALLSELARRVEALEGVEIGVVMGRQWFCDRSGNEGVTEIATGALRAHSALPLYSPDALAAHLASGQGEASFPAHAGGRGREIRDGEHVLHTAHRADRARQVIVALKKSQRVLTLVDPGLENTDDVFFLQTPLVRGLAVELASSGIAATRVAEKCKFPHVTFFMDGFRTHGGGRRICVPSVPEAEIRERPEMSAGDVTKEVLRALEDPAEKFVIANLANLDQVGHLGDLTLAERAAKIVDESFRAIAEVCRENGWTLVVTADHGNADQVERNGASFGSHTDRPVPLVVVPAQGACAWRSRSGTLANVAATCLTAAGLDVPDWMEPSLIEELGR